ncbi:hypothetical protein EHF33_16635 (plasmid) [Deinococcus psychrotolerans]|uniref:Uncharacterized protein n=1 Tax=Deinococcus psychrotolerans TaxID=2489213 RepID=A0A3G8YGW9_9DEIO|nr:hypothetical protein [Deinococcus psychrotolerans]AZI44538.1 hypothetical protein EHF33_16635 [Deinococcus psychrotolerans]
MTQQAFDSLSTRVTFSAQTAQWAAGLRPPLLHQMLATPLTTHLQLERGPARADGQPVRLSWSGGNVEARRSGNRVCIPEVLAFDVQPRLTHVELGPDAESRAADAWLGLHLAFAETQRAAGWLSLHAALLKLAGPNAAERLIAITGPSGAGKSTAALRLMQRGAAVVAEDSGWLSPEGEVFGWDSNLRLRPGTLSQFAPSLSRAGQDAHGKDVIEVGRSVGGPLASIWVLGAPHGQLLSAADQVRAWWEMSGLPITLAARRGAQQAVARCCAPNLTNIPVYGLNRDRLFELEDLLKR